MKMLFYDIDGTILSDITKKIPESTREALKMAKKNGHQIFVNTGRTICSVPSVIKDMEFDGFLCGCGTYILYEGQVLLSHSIPRERGYAYVDEMKRCNVEGFLEGTEDIYFSENPYKNPKLEKARGYMADRGLGLLTSMEKKNYQYDKLLIRVDDKSDTERFFTAIREDLIPIDRLHGVYECVQKEYSKATAIEYMRQYLGVGKDQIYVFGDSSNDLAMFEYADHAIAMGAHDPVLEPYTEYVADTVENDGIYKAMEHYGFI